MIVEPLAHDRVEDNFNPVGRIYHIASTLICVPASYAQETKLGLGAKPARRPSEPLWKKRDSAISVEPQKPRSTWCSRLGRSSQEFCALNHDE